jgi:hypothetical protein
MGDVRREHEHEEEQQILADITNGTGKTFNDSERGRGRGTERERGWRKFVKYFSPSYVLSCISTRHMVAGCCPITRLMSFLFFV